MYDPLTYYMFASASVISIYEKVGLAVFTLVTLVIPPLFYHVLQYSVTAFHRIEVFSKALAIDSKLYRCDYNNSIGGNKMYLMGRITMAAIAVPFPFNLQCLWALVVVLSTSSRCVGESRSEEAMAVRQDVFELVFWRADLELVQGNRLSGSMRVKEMSLAHQGADLVTTVASLQTNLATVYFEMMLYLMMTTACMVCYVRYKETIERNKVARNMVRFNLGNRAFGFALRTVRKIYSEVMLTNRWEVKVSVLTETGKERIELRRRVKLTQNNVLRLVASVYIVLLRVVSVELASQFAGQVTAMTGVELIVEEAALISNEYKYLKKTVRDRKISNMRAFECTPGGVKFDGKVDIVAVNTANKLLAPSNIPVETS